MNLKKRQDKNTNRICLSSSQESSIISCNGFTLVEVLVSMFIFTLMFSVSAMIFANLFGNYKDAKNIQQDIDNAQFSMNGIMKTLRTSSIVEVAGNKDITIYNYSQSECINYSFSLGGLNIASSPTDFGDCNSTAAGSSELVTSGNIDGRFTVFPSVGSDPGPAVVGRVTVFMEITEGDDQIRIQSTTSLRDYVVSEIEMDL